MKTKNRLVYLVLSVLFLSGCSDELDLNKTNKQPSPTPGPGSTSSFSLLAISEAMFDDFNYTGASDPLLATNQWETRTGKGGPGPRGVSWSSNNITFIADPGNTSNKLLRLIGSTNGTARTTVQAEIVTSQSKFFEGTYAARVKFSDTPISGTDGAETVQTFFTISPYSTSDPLYSELDFEYLSNGGWGITGPTMWNTSWNSTSVRTSTSTTGSLDRWNDLLLTVSGGIVKYYVNGVLTASHTGIYYPRRGMYIDFNLWFINSKNPASTYVEDVDWVYFAKNTVLTTSEVNAEVNNYRTNAIRHVDNVAP
jgi:hypothetical protein